jgi:superfamily II DNA or RNA helicase
MQPLCPDCDRKKGNLMLRKHQRECELICQDILASVPVRDIYAAVTPGGGKSLLPVIVAHQLIPTLADAVCWVVPRVSLMEQAEMAFISSANRRLLGHSIGIRASTNDIDPCRGLAGYVTTYHAIAADSALHAAEFRRKRYILILDEPHHVEASSSWQRALQPLVDTSVLRMFMSGTWERGDGRRIAFLPYRSVVGGATPDFTPSHTTAVLSYSRSEALEERAIKQLRLHALDCHAEWIDRDGELRQLGSLAEAGDLSNDALMTALHSEAAFQLLDRCLANWRSTRTQQPRVKMLVVANSISRARDYLNYLDKRGEQRVAIATSDDSDLARDAIRRFKLQSKDAERIDVLVTVAMAYEGLDVPAISHLACLTHIRSRPWIEQMIARAARVDPRGGPYEEQLGHIYAPDDQMLLECFAAMLAEQAALVRDDLSAPPEVPSAVSASTNGSSAPGLSIIPLLSETTRERLLDFGNGETMSYTEFEAVLAHLEAHGLGGLIDPITWRRAGGKLPEHTVPAEPQTRLLTPSERETRIRKALEVFCRHYDHRALLPSGTMSRALRQEFGKPRDQLTEAELMQAWSWALRNTPGH